MELGTRLAGDRTTSRVSSSLPIPGALTGEKHSLFLDEKEGGLQYLHFRRVVLVVLDRVGVGLQRGEVIRCHYRRLSMLVAQRSIPGL